MAAGGGDKLISIWNVITGERKSTLAREATVYSIIFSPTGDLLSTGGGDKQASLWSRHGRLLAESPGLDSAVKALAFSSTGSELACAQGKEVRLSTVVSDPATGESRLKPHMNEEVSRIVNLPLLRATKEGDLDEVDNLLEMGLVDVNFANQHGDTPLILACWYGHKYIAARLLDSGAQLDVANCDGNCALNVAAYRGNSEAVEMLIRHGATVDVPDHMTGKTALVKAAYVGHTPTAIALLDAKANVNAADNQGYTALAFATSFNHEYMPSRRPTLALSSRALAHNLPLVNCPWLLQVHASGPPPLGRRPKHAGCLRHHAAHPRRRARPTRHRADAAAGRRTVCTRQRARRTPHAARRTPHAALLS